MSSKDFLERLQLTQITDVWQRCLWKESESLTLSLVLLCRAVEAIRVSTEQNLRKLACPTARPPQCLWAWNSTEESCGVKSRCSDF